MKCLYHANCLDGSGAALAVWAKYGDTGHDYIPCQYGNDLPDDLAGSDVIMVDFTAKKQQIQDLAKIASSILIIDHHKTAQADLDGVDDGFGCLIETVFNMEKSGAVLAWEFFHPATPVPEILNLIQDRDLWRFDYETTQDVTHGLHIYPEWRGWLDIDIDKLASEGSPIRRFLMQQAEKIVTTRPTGASSRWSVTGDTVPVYNLQGFMISDTLHMALEQYPEAPYAVSYFDLPDKRVYSLRSRSGTDVDVSLIAARYGGGGHKHAAGFSLSHDLAYRPAIKPL